MNLTTLDGMLRALEPSDIRDLDLVHKHTLQRRRIFGYPFGTPVYRISIMMEHVAPGKQLSLELATYRIPTTDTFTTERETKRFQNEYLQLMDRINTYPATPKFVARPREFIGRWNSLSCSLGFYAQYEKFRYELRGTFSPPGLFPG